jgi:hypothetical protein
VIQTIASVTIVFIHLTRDTVFTRIVLLCIASTFAIQVIARFGITVTATATATYYTYIYIYIYIYYYLLLMFIGVPSYVSMGTPTINLAFPAFITARGIRIDGLIVRAAVVFERRVSGAGKWCRGSRGRVVNL